jgi:predicted permease
METLINDVRFALRVLRRNPVFSAIAVVTLSIGIGADTAMFSVMNAVLLEPLPYEQPERLAFVWERNSSIGKDRDPVAPLNYQDWQSQSTAFDALAAYRTGTFVLTGGEQAEQVTALAMSSSLFPVLGVNPRLGRAFTDAEVRGRERVVALSHEFWQRRFGGDRSLVGKAIALNDASFTVVGVMPPLFRFPEGQPVDMYTPLVFAPDELRGRRSHTLSVIGRLKEGVTIEAASTNIGGIARNIAASDNTSNPDATVVGAQDLLVEDVRLAILVLFGAVGLVLLIACVNVANLLLARAASRQREMAIRVALGGNRRRLIRQLLTESLLLAVISGLLGAFVAWSVLWVFIQIGPPDLPRVQQVGIDLNVLLFVSAVTVVTGIVFGIVPALHTAGSRTSAADVIKQTSVTVSGTFRRNHGRAVLVIAEVAFSVILLSGAGLMIRSFLNARSLDAGFRPENVLTLQISLPFARYPVDPAQYRPVPADQKPLPASKAASFVGHLLERIEALPGVESAGAVTSLPMNPVGIDFDLPVIVQGKSRPRPGEEPQADFRVATVDYFQTMGIAVLDGRTFTEFDGLNSASVAIINDTMARQIFPGERPIGQRLLLYGRPREIVGVVGSVRHHGYNRAPRPEMVLPFQQFQFGTVTLVVRSALDPAQLGAAITREVRAMDAALPVTRVRPLTTYLSDSVSTIRFTTLLFGAFAGIALLLAIVGVYGVMAFTTAQRAHEIGVRIALGANRSTVLTMVVSQGMRLALIGVTVGLIGAAIGSRWISGLLFGVAPIDALTFSVAGTALVTASLAATYIPARRATRLNPVTTLRSE